MFHLTFGGCNNTSIIKTLKQIPRTNTKDLIGNFVCSERLEDHLQATGRLIAYPIRLSVKQLRESGLNDEGLFRISPKQIKLDKVNLIRVDRFVNKERKVVSTKQDILESGNYLHQKIVAFLNNMLICYLY